MGYERYPRGNNAQGDDYGRSDAQDYGSGRGYSSAREYEAAGMIGPDRDGDRRPYGARDYGHDRYAHQDRSGRDQYARGPGGHRGGYGAQDRYPQDRYAQDRHGQGGDRAGGRDYYRGDRDDRGSHAAGPGRFEEAGRYRQGGGDDRQRGYGAQPQGYDYEDRGFFQRAGDEVRSWFGDDDAERRREMDSRYDERSYGGGSYGGSRHDDDYHSWRSGQIAALDRDYDEYRRENRSRFENEFSTWRAGRQGQRDRLNKVQEHQEVVGSDGAHVGTVDKVKGDRILLTKNDADAGGQHHSIPSGWITSVDDKVTVSKTAAEARQAWRDEDRQSAMFTDGDNARGQGQSGGRTDEQANGQSSGQATGRPDDKRGLNRSFPGTY